MRRERNMPLLIARDSQRKETAISKRQKKILQKKKKKNRVYEAPLCYHFLS